MMSMTPDWGQFWDTNAQRPDNFGATGRSGMEVVGFLHTVRETARILKLSPSDRLLDIGCGTGIFAMALSPIVHSVHGIDFSPRMIERSEANCRDCDDLTFSVGTICKPDVSKGRYNKILSYSVLQYLAGPEEVIEAFKVLYDLLPDGGIALYAANPDPARRNDYLETALAGRDDAECERIKQITDQVLWMAPSDMAALAREAGLTASVEVISSDIWQHFYMYDLVVEKS